MRILSLLLVLVLLTGCSAAPVATVSTEETIAPAQNVEAIHVVETAEIPYVSRFNSVTEIQLSDNSITVNGGAETDNVYTSNDIVYYEDKDAYESGNPYGEGEAHQRHSVEEAAAHTVVNITAPGAYRVSGKLSAGQIRVDLGDDAYYEADAVVELILSDTDITCTVAPAILFLNTYECDGNWSTETAKAEVDTVSAGASLILEGNNTITGSHVAKIFKDKDGEKKLWKQDGAVYSYMSLNVYGPGALQLTADNEGLDTELHLTINGGNITILSDNDGINTNEDGVSVTTINAGNLTIHAGLGAEGDGIDSNGYLVINGGTVISAAKPMADAGLDSDLGSYINGGTVVAMGSTMDWAESESQQVTMNLSFAQRQKEDSKIAITQEDGTEIFTFDTGSEYGRGFSGLILSSPALKRGETYHVYIDGVQMAYTGTDVGGFPGGFGGGFGGRPGNMGEMPEGFEPGQMPEGFEGFGGQMPEDFDPSKMEGFPGGGKMPEGFDPSQMGGGRGQRPEGMEMPEGMQRPEGFGKERPEGMERGEMPEGFEPGQMPEGFEGFGGQMPGGFGGRGEESGGEASTSFYMNDMVNAFSGVKEAT